MGNLENLVKQALSSVGNPGILTDMVPLFVTSAVPEEDVSRNLLANIQILLAKGPSSSANSNSNFATRYTILVKSSDRSAN